MRISPFEKWFVNREAKGRRNFERVRSRLIACGVEPFCAALELGCGIGVVSALLAETYGMRVCGVDLDPEQVRRARAMHGEAPRLAFRVEDATRLGFADASFDLVVAQNVFHHIPDWRAAVREVARVLRPGGIVVWDDFALSRRLERWARPLARRAGVYSRISIRSAFRAAGLESRFHARHGALLAREQMVFERIPEQSPLWSRGAA
jgi:SAM-dependent methyltransferase